MTRIKTKLLSQRGFTLLELILVMIILCTVLAMAAPSLRGFFSSRRINDMAEQLAIHARYAKIQAISQSLNYRLNYDPVRRAFWVSSVQSGGYARIENDFGNDIFLPSDVQIFFENVPIQSGLYFVEYDPQGFCRQCVIRFEDRKSNVLELVCSSPSEDFKVVEVNDAG